MLATVRSGLLLGVSGHVVDVQVHVADGLPSFSMVGLPDAACREARDRVRAALLSSGWHWPMKRITVNLAPSGVPKLGTGLDLAIAVGVLVASGALSERAVEGYGFCGELGLDGAVRSVRGLVPVVAGLADAVDRVVVSPDGAGEASLVHGVGVLVAPDLASCVACLEGTSTWPPLPRRRPRPVLPLPDLADVRGQSVARRALEIAAAGGHHILLSGPPGSGKTLLASRLPGLLPDLGDDEAMAVTTIHSAVGLSVADGLIRRPPFRAPHHTASAVSLIGGGTAAMRPGEVSCAHEGVLFCDELGEFPPTVLDALRQPLEEGVVRVARARGTVTYPARFQFVAATNPCPCGPAPGGCRCAVVSQERYARRLSGPLVDRFDLRIDVQRPDPSQLLGSDPGDPTAVVAARVRVARARALDRGVSCNARLSDGALERAAPFDAKAAALLRDMVSDGRLSGRGVQRIRRVALTVGDLEGHDGPLSLEHVSTALAFRLSVAFGPSEVRR